MIDLGTALAEIGTDGEKLGPKNQKGDLQGP